MQRGVVIIALLALCLSSTLQHLGDNEEEEAQGVKKFEETLAKSIDLLKKTLETKNITNFSFSLNLTDFSPPSEPLPLPSLSPVDLSSPKEKLLRSLSRVDYLLLFLSSPWCAECKEKREEIEEWVRGQKGLEVIAAPPAEYANDRKDTAKSADGMEWIEGGLIMIAEVNMEEIIKWEEMKDLFAPFHSPPPSFRLLRRIPPSTSFNPRHQCRASMVRESVEEYMRECGTFLRSLSSSPPTLLNPSLLPPFSARSFVTIYLPLNPKQQDLNRGVIEMWKRRLSDIAFDSSLLQLALIPLSIIPSIEGEEWKGVEGVMLLQLGAPSKHFDLKSPGDIKEIENELLSRLLSPPALRGLSHHLLQLPLPFTPLHFRPPLPTADRFCILLLPDHSSSIHFPLLHSFHLVASQFPSFRFLYFTSGHRGLAERLNVKEMPAMFILEHNKKYEYSGEWNEDGMEEFCLKHQMNLSSPPALRSAPISPSSSPISDLTADIIVPFLDSHLQSNILVFFYSPACYFCKSVRSTLLHEFENRLRRAGVENNALEIATYNTFENDLPPFLFLSRKVNESPLNPQLVLFTASDDTSMRTTYLYNSPYSFNHLLNFLLTKAQITDSEQLAKLRALQA